MIPIRARILTAAALATLSAGCVLSFQEQEVRWTVDPGNDRIEALLLTGGFEVRHEEGEDGERRYKKRDVNTARRAVADLAEGRRRFFLFWSLWDFDVEEALEDGLDGETDPLQVQMWALLADLEVLESGMFLDGGDRLTTWQRLRIPHAARLVALANEALNRELTLADVDELVAGGFDEREFLEKCVERARRREPWIELDGSRITVSLPATEEELARLRRRAFQVDSARYGTNEWGVIQLMAGALAHLESTVFTDGGCRLVFAPRPDGTFALHVGVLGVECDSHLRDVLVEEGRTLEAPDLDALRASLSGS